MWQLLALGSLAATALENVADKAAIVRDRSIHYAVASFWRNALFLFFTAIVGYMGWFGQMHFYFGWPVLVFACFAVLSSYFYTYLLQRIEVTGIAVDTYLMPLVFLVIDTVYLQVGLTFDQIIGIILLTLGGFAFALDGKTHRMKREWTWAVWGIFAFWIVYDGFEYYLFKYLHAAEGVNSVSFSASAWLIVSALILLHIVYLRKTSLVFGRDAQKYIPAVSFSKLFDTASTLLWLQALTFAAVSQVTAIGAIEPLVLFILATVVQKATRFNIKERVDRANIHWKLAAVLLVCVGTYVVS